MLAALHGHLELAQLLVQRGANLDVAAKFNLTALMLAIVNLHEDIAVALIEAGADLEHRGSGAPGFAGLSALDLARMRELEAVVAAIDQRSQAPR
jgi:ankyrin repeat protein